MKFSQLFNTLNPFKNVKRVTANNERDSTGGLNMDNNVVFENEDFKVMEVSLDDVLKMLARRSPGVFNQQLIGNTAKEIVAEQGETSYINFISDTSTVSKLANLATECLGDRTALIKESQGVLAMMQVCISIGAAYERCYGPSRV